MHLHTYAGSDEEARIRVAKEDYPMPMFPPPGKKVVFVKWITRRGRRVYASQYGLQAFRIWVNK